jgi:hypothetical protein
VRIHRLIPGTVYVAALSIAIAYGSPELYPGGESSGGDAQRRSSSLVPRDIEYHVDPSKPAWTSGVSFDLSGRPRHVRVEIGDRSAECRPLADDRWYCPAASSIATLESLHVMTGGGE